jgi:hypothetical protein
MIKTITNSQIERAKIVLKDHIPNPLTEASAFEAGLFSISSQGTPWEIASSIIYNLREISRPNDQDARHKCATLDTLRNVDAINLAALRAGWRFASENRYAQFIEHFARASPDYIQEVRNADIEVRDRYVEKVKWLSNKTFSFWNICLGGQDLVALDVHVMRGLRRLGLTIEESFVTPKSRSVGAQKVRKTPGRKRYLAIESEAKDLFAKDPRFIKADSRVDCALIDGVLWWGGAARGNPSQGYLFGNGQQSCLTLPYAEAIAC